MATFPSAEPGDSIQALRLNGIPIFVAPSAPLPQRACLVFRVGLVDESLSRRGLTHLVEHLALNGLGERPYRFNGMVDGLFARFYMSGRAKEIAEFFNHVVVALENLPRDRVLAEAAVLRTEAAHRSMHWLQAMLNYRYGSTGWGLAGAQEYGLRNPDPDDVQAWARTRFTAENAALWVSGPLPDGLTINLPPGQRMPPTEPTSVLTGFPAWVTEDAAGVGLSMTGKRSSALRAVLQVAQRRAQAELREGALSYSVEPSYEALNKDRAHLALWADALPANAQRVCEGLIRVVERVVEAGPRPEELDQYIEEMQRAQDSPDSVLLWLETAATGELLGSAPLDRDAWSAEVRAVTPETARDSLAEAMESALLMTPAPVTRLATRFTRVSQWSTESVTGMEVGLRLGLSSVGRAIRLTVADNGVTFAFDRSRLVTVWFDRCAALLTWNDGSRTLQGVDGFRLHLCPRDWHNGSQIMRWIDGHVAKDVVVAMGDRPNPDPGIIVREPTYKLTTGHLGVITAGLWVGVVVGGILLAGSEERSGALVPLLLMGILGLRLSTQLYFRLRAPRVRQV